jgi:hypothetical protein
MPLKIESSGSTISLRAQIGSVRWIFLGVPLLAWSQGNLKLDGSGRFVSYLVAFLFVTLGLLVGLQPSIESTFDLAAKVIRIRRRTAIVLRESIVPFATVEGLGLRESVHESGSSYTAQLRTLDGTIHKLTAVSAAYFHADDLLEQIRQATGLPRLDWPAG